MAAGLTQDGLAARARISVQAISALERGARHAPRGDTLALLRDALGLAGDALAEFEASARASAKPRVRATQPLFKAAGSKRATLPKFATPFFGRERDVRELASAVASGGCTTLWGTGGVGKTRLAVETSALVEDRFDRIAFVGLATAIGDDAVDGAIASALGITLEPREDAFEQIARALSAQRWLVIVDNCEHVVAGAARRIGALSAALPECAFVCTSRQPLRIVHERVLAVGVLAAGDARRLFLDRATVPRGIALSPRDASNVETICRRLDGIPLALELAAACTGVLDLDHVAGGLDERFRLLTHGDRAAVDRHTTLEATIAWSYGLLEPHEQRVFEFAAVINGGFSLDDLLAIAVGTGCERAAVLTATMALAEQALLVVEGDGAAAPRRYRLLESTRAFALEAAASRGTSTLAAAHRCWGRHLSDRFIERVERYRDGDVAAFADAPLDQLRGYLEWSIEKQNDVAAGTQLAGSLHLLWDHRGLAVEGLRRIGAGLALLPDEGGDAPVAMLGWYATARLKQRLVRNAESLEPALRAYGLAARLGDDLIRAQAAGKLAVAFDIEGERRKAIDYAEESIVIYERLGDRSSAAYAACSAAMIAFKISGDAAALEKLRTALHRQRAIGGPRRTSSAEMDFAEAYFARGMVEEAIATLTPALAGFRRTASLLELAIGLNNLATYLIRADRCAEAAPVAREALQIGLDGGHTRMIVLAAQACATIAVLSGTAQRACAELFGYVDRRYGTIGEIEYTERDAHERFRAAIARLLPEHEAAEAGRVGADFDDEIAAETALTLLSGC